MSKEQNSTYYPKDKVNIYLEGISYREVHPRDFLKVVSSTDYFHGTFELIFPRGLPLVTTVGPNKIF